MLAARSSPWCHPLGSVLLDPGRPREVSRRAPEGQLVQEKYGVGFCHCSFDFVSSQLKAEFSTWPSAVAIFQIDRQRTHDTYSGIVPGNDQNQLHHLPLGKKG